MITRLLLLLLLQSIVADKRDEATHEATHNNGSCFTALNIVTSLRRRRVEGAHPARRYASV